MNLEQISKRIDWIEDQRRGDRDIIASLDARILALEGELNAANRLIADQNGEITRFGAVLGKVSQFEVELSQHRLEVASDFEEIESKREERFRESEAIRRTQLDGINTHILDLKKQLDVIPGLQEGIRARIEEETRLLHQIEEVKLSIVDVKREEEKRSRVIRVIEESGQRDNKRLTDFQGDLLAVRKRVDEHRGRIDLVVDNVQRSSSRVNEIATVEGERREMVSTFVEKQNLIQADRERKWREWQQRFETVEKQALELEGYLQEMHLINRDIRQSQEKVDAVTDRVDRRVNEITEMQRLAEDRFRQEWVTFKADDQKRWTNYSLTQEEQTREGSRQTTKMTDRLTSVEELLQEMQDTINQLNELTSERLQSLLSSARDWVSEYEKVFGRVNSAG